MRKLLVFIGFLLFTTSAFAKTSNRRICKDMAIVFNGIALNAAAGTRTATISNLDGFDILLFTAAYTHANNGTLTFTLTGKSAYATDLGSAKPTQVDTTLTTCTTAAGTCTLNFAGVVVTPSLSANKYFSFPVGISGEATIKVVVAHGGTPNASDLLTVTARKCVSR